MQLPSTSRTRPVTPRSELLFSIDIGARSGALLVRVAGELDLAGGRRLQDALEPFLGRGPGLVELDLQAISFADSSGAMSLVDLANRIRQSGGRLEIRRCSKAVVRLFDMLIPSAVSLPIS